MNNTDSAWEAVRNAAIGAENYKRARRDANIDLFSRAAANAAHYAISKSILKETEDDLKLLNTDLEKERPVEPESPEKASTVVPEVKEYTVQQDASNTNDTVSAWDEYSRSWKKQPVDKMVNDTLNDIDNGRYNDYEQRRKEYDERMKQWNARVERQKELNKKGRVGILEDSALRLAMHNPDWSARMSQKAENERQRQMQYDKFRLEHAKEFAKSALAIMSNDDLRKAYKDPITYQDKQYNVSVNEELNERRKEAMAYAPKDFEKEKGFIDDDEALLAKLEGMLPMKNGEVDLEKIKKMDATERSQLFKAFSDLARFDPNTGRIEATKAPGVFGYIQSLWRALQGAVIGKQNVKADDIVRESKAARKDIETRKEAFDKKWEERRKRGRDKWSYRVQQGFDDLMGEFKYKKDEPVKDTDSTSDKETNPPATNNAATTENNVPEKPKAPVTGSGNAAIIKAIEATAEFKSMRPGQTKTITIDGKQYKVKNSKGSAKIVG